MLETVEPRIVFVDTQSEAVLIDTCQTTDGEVPTDKAQALEWAFADSNLGLRLGQLCCSPKIELQRTNGAGVGAFARTAIKAGEEVLRELPLLRIDWAAQPPDMAAACAQGAAEACQILSPEMRHFVTEATLLPAVAFARAPPEVRAEVLALHTPAPDTVPLELREAVSAGVKYLQQNGWLQFSNSSVNNGKNNARNRRSNCMLCSRSDRSSQSPRGGSNADSGRSGRHNQLAKRPNEDADAAHIQSACERAVFVFLSTVFDASDEAFYSGEYLAHGTGTGMALALFRVGSRLNHSCLPNCWWRVEDGKHMVITALVDVAPGAELTHAYFETERWQARPLRRQALAGKFFVCHCARCVEEERASALDASDAALAAADRRNFPHAHSPHHRGSAGVNCERRSLNGDTWVDRSGFRAEAGAADARRVHEGGDRANHQSHTHHQPHPVNTATWARLSPEELVAYCQQHWNELDAQGVNALKVCFERQCSQQQHQQRFGSPLQGGGFGLATSHRPSKLALFADLHDLMADLHKMSGLWAGAATHLHAQRVCLWQLYPRPSNRSAWLAEACGDCWAAATGMVPLKEVFDADWLDAVTSLSVKLLQTAVPAGVAATLEALPEKCPFFLKASVAGKHSGIKALALYEAAQSELELVYGHSQKSARHGQRSKRNVETTSRHTASLERKIRAVKTALRKSSS